MSLLPILERFFRYTVPLAPGDRLLVAFSGGADSTALLWGLAEVAPRLGVELTAAHLDHGLDPGAAGRAEAARGLADRLGVPLVADRRAVAGLAVPSESPEAAARRVRYQFLDEVRRSRGARWVATAHHRDDQAETVVLRLLFGSGLAGLAGIRPVHGTVVRPLLGCGKAELLQAVREAGLAPLAPVIDPTNDDLAVPRNRVRHRLLPALAALDGGSAGEAEDLARRLAGLAGRAERAGQALERRLAERLGDDPAGLSREELAELPEPLLGWALAALHRRAGAPYPASRAARAELLRQLAAGPRVGCDCGGGWRWHTAGEGSRLELGGPNSNPGRRPGHSSGVETRDPAPGRPAQAAASAGFSYTLDVPGEVVVPEISARVRLSRQSVAPWMFQGAARRAALDLPVEAMAAGEAVTVRNRRPGDRVLPLGAPGSRRLKDLLIDRRVPREERDRLPLLCVGGRIAWVPGVTIDQRFRLAREPLPAGGAAVWVAEVLPA